MLEKINSMMSGYDNLKLLLSDNDSPERLAPIKEEISIGRKHKRPTEELSRAQIKTPNSTQGNFVFRKKKLQLKDVTDGSNVSHLPFGREFSFAAEDSAFNGKKIIFDILVILTMMYMLYVVILLYY